MKLMRTALATLLAASLALTGCGKGDEDGKKEGGKIELTVATFNEFGYDNLFKKYMDQNPNVVVKHKKAATSDEARQNLLTGLAAGKGLADVEGVEVAWFAELGKYGAKFADLKDDALKDRWLDWKVKAATLEDGKLLGYGTDIGPEAVCYRADLFKKAGLPTDREEVAKLLEGDWDKYFEVGKQFTSKTKIPWYDGASGLYNGMIQQLANPYEESDGKPKPLESNTDVKNVYDQLVKHKDLSAGLGQWSEDWTAAFQKSGFATMLCPAWMTGVIEGNAKGVEGWDIANVFPGGGGNWGGSYLTVPAQGKNVEEAKKLAAWLTAPEQQIEAFKTKGTFPSQTKALDDKAVLDQKNPFFNDAPVGKIFSDRAKAIKTQPFVGPNFFTINTVVADAITRFDVEKKNPDESWKQALTAYKELSLK
ncbi:extracellular solute-binding protein [Aestuariimicrobium sp. p3-SID1156]|uniref:ABC transporter substrate-binding protein n=1 Tax=Aestuariimicrobium sp. p3-SID1156 TaxID=2916038 RepID=UPI00223AA269|nr:extracellular solute-binding protein [Aestuariimicrobium sp. p3-SID1156]MCT1460313.1 extracellular solute-binding protein [Aestuariimicrobium sp. p3-SID1156]